MGLTFAYLKRTFEEVGRYDELVVLKDIRVVSFCEHHMLPVIGRAHVGYPPTNRVVGISKMARVVHGFARRLQIQEKLTAEIAEAIQDILEPQGVGVVIEAEHSCMTLRGVNTLRIPAQPKLGGDRLDRETQLQPRLTAATVAGGDFVFVGGESCQDFGLLPLRDLEEVEGPSEFRCDLIKFCW